MTDLAALKSNFNLLAELPDLKKIGPRYWGGPCPFCGGTDRFQLKETDQGYIWLCRHCSPDGRNGKKYQDVVEYLALRNGLDLHASSPAQRFTAMTEVSRLLGGTLVGDRPAPRPAPIPMPAHAPDWQTAAYEILLACEKNLYSAMGARALAWLTGPERCLTTAALRTWNIGYSNGFSCEGIWVPRGVVVPCFEYGDVWYFKIRLVPGETFKCVACKAEQDQPGKCQCGKVNKYRGVSGNKPGLFGAGTLHGSDIAIIAEGEFDAMLLWSAVAKLPGSLCNRVAVITTGASSHYLDKETWKDAVIGSKSLIKKFVCIYDEDEAGEKAYRHMSSITSRAVRAHLPKMTLPIIKDVTDYVKTGGNLAAWINYQIDQPRRDNDYESV